jgi:hypothetical protein
MNPQSKWVEINLVFCSARISYNEGEGIPLIDISPIFSSGINVSNIEGLVKEVGNA